MSLYSECSIPKSNPILNPRNQLIESSLLRLNIVQYVVAFPLPRHNNHFFVSVCDSSTYMVMGTTMMTMFSNPRIAELPYREWTKPETTVTIFAKCLNTTAFGFSWKLRSRCSFAHVAEPYIAGNYKRMAWEIRSSVDGSGLDPSSSSDTNRTTRLIRAIQDLQRRLGERIKETRKNLPMKLLFLLVGFYCATAFATVIGQTGDWDILSAALAVVVVEGIGAVMYKASFTLLNNVRGLITMFNYWKAGLCLGLFLDSFKYEMDNLTTFSFPFALDADIFSMFL